MNNVKKKIDKENKKRVAIALWRSNVTLKDIRSQTKIPEKTLWRILVKVWTENMDDIQCLRNLIESMPGHLQDVLERDGGCTKY